MRKNLKLFLFSDHRTPADLPLDREMIATTGKKNPTVAWIPSGGSPEKTDHYFTQRRARYAEVGVTSVEMFPLHREGYHLSIPHLLSCDIIHLSGGDPFVFLKNLRAAGLMSALSERALLGGIMVGESGGAMMMAHDIEMCRFGHIPVPEDLANLEALGLLDFDFHPHFGSYGANLDQLKEYSQRRQKIVYAVPDGAGLVVLGGEVRPHGHCVRIKSAEEEEPNKSP
jgi:dipeptidase E